MTPVLSIRDQACANPTCVLQGRTDAINVVVHSRRERRLQCKVCKKTWVAHRDEPTYGLRSDLEKIGLAIDLMRNGMSIRGVARAVEVSPSTVQRWKRRLV